MDVGNFCAFDSKHLKSLLRNKNICIAFCSGAIKNLKSIFYYGVKKKKRYFGSSKVNFFFLIKHSLNIITVLPSYQSVNWEQDIYLVNEVYCYMLRKRYYKDKVL